MKYSSTEGVVSWSGGQILLRHGQSIEEDHPLYSERPDLFQGLAPAGAEIDHRQRPGVVEANMQAPGTNRMTRVPKGGSAQ